MKKSISLLLVLALLCAFLPTLALPVAAAESDPVAAAKDGDTVTLDGVDYTVLKDPATLVSTVTTDPKGKYILGCDMDMGGKQYKNALFGGENFEGTLDGNGHSITGFSVKSSNGNTGLIFARVTSSKTVIRNLTVGSPEAPLSLISTSTAAGMVGGLTGKTENGKTTVENVTVYANVRFEGKVSNTVVFGGIIGRSRADTVTNCRFYGSVIFAESTGATDKNTYVGGIVGRVEDTSTLTVTGCENHASIDTSVRKIGSNTKQMLGGIFGGSSSGATAIITDCANYGTLKSDQYAGGIIGGIHNTAAKLTLQNVRNHADITSTTTDTGNDNKFLKNGLAGAGGIIGGLSNIATATVSDFAVTGKISSNGSSLDKSTTTGVVGYICSQTSDSVVLRNGYADVSIYSNYLTLTGMESVGYYGICTAYAKANDILVQIQNVYFRARINDGDYTSSGCHNTRAHGTWFDQKDTPESFAGGAVAAGLGTGWGQRLGTDAYPVCGSPAAVAKVGDQYVNAERLLKQTEETYEAYIQKSDDSTRLRILLLSAATALPEGKDMTVRVGYTADGKTHTRSFTVTGDRFTLQSCVRAADRRYCTEEGISLLGAVISGIPASVFDAPVTVTVTFDTLSGTTAFN